MSTEATAAKAGIFNKKTLIAVGAPVLLIVAYVAVKAMMGSAPERPKVDAAISGQQRATFVKSFNDTCLKRQRTASVNASVPDAKLTAYCGCWSEAVAGETTNFELQFNAGVLSQAQIDRNERLAKACMTKI